MQVMVITGTGRVIVVKQFAHTVGKPGLVTVDDWRMEPFDQGRITFIKEFQCLAQIPAAEIKVIFYRQFNNISFGFKINGKIPALWMNIDETYIPVAVC